MLTIQNHSTFFKWSTEPALLQGCSLLLFALHSSFLQTKKKNEDGELSKRSSCATFLSCLVQDRCLGFEPVENKASSWLLYFKQERPPKALHIPIERENKWLSSFPGTSAQEELFGKQPFHSAHVLLLDGSGGHQHLHAVQEQGEWCGEYARMAGNCKLLL